jgi:PKD repeat protein
VAWSGSFGDKTSSTSTSPSHTYAAAGTYSVKLTVTDDHGAQHSTTKSVTVTAPTAPNQPPVANFTFSCTGLACTFSNTSTDPDGTIASSSWAFGDGGSSGSPSPSHTYAAAGTYAVKLTVTDDKGASASTTKNVTVSVPAPIALTANGSKVRGLQRVDLSWKGAATASVTVFRDGTVIATAPNSTTTQSGSYVDDLNRKGSATYKYKVCEPGSTTQCSSEVTVVF